MIKEGGDRRDEEEDAGGMMIRPEWRKDGGWKRKGNNSDKRRV